MALYLYKMYDPYEDGCGDRVACKPLVFHCMDILKGT